MSGGVGSIRLKRPRISQRDIQRPVRCLNGSQTSALGNRFRRKHIFIME